MDTASVFASRPLSPLLAGDREGRSASPVQVTTVDTTERCQALRAEWEDLLTESSADCLFLTWEWLFTWWQELGRGRRLALREVRRDGRLIGLAPWMLRRGLPARLELLGNGRVGSDYLDVIARNGSEGEVSAALAADLDRRGGVVVMTQLRQSSLAARLSSLLGEHRWRSLRDTTHVCPFIALDGLSWQDFLQSLGPSHRSNVRRRLRKLHARYAVTFERADDAAHAAESFDVLLRLHRLRWSQRGGSDGFTDPPLVAFHRRFSRLALERGWLRLYVLRLDGRPAAAWYGFRYGHRFLFYQSGFDPAFAGSSVGLASMSLAIQAAIAEGAAELDLLHGAEPYKLLWTREARPLERLELFPPSALGTLRRQLTCSIRGAKRLLRHHASPAAEALP